MDGDLISIKSKVIMAISILFLFIMPIICIYHTYQLNTEIKAHNLKLEEINKQTESVKNELEIVNKELNEISKKAHDRSISMHDTSDEISRGMERAFRCTVTGYDLSVQSCGKTESHPAYGLTASGVRLAGHDLYSARAIAVDPNVIPLGSKVRIKFDNEKMSKYNGVYTAVDTGGAIKGNRIDLFFEDCGSDSVSDEATRFGVQTALVQII